MQWRHQPWGTGARAPWSLRMHANFAAVQTMAALIFLPSLVSSQLDRQSHQLLWQAVAKNFSHIRFCRPNARWLSLLHDFVIMNFGIRAPHARAPEQNSGDATVCMPRLTLRVNKFRKDANEDKFTMLGVELFQTFTTCSLKSFSVRWYDNG